MGVKRILLFTLGVIVLLLGITGVYLYNRLNSESRLPEHIPVDAEAVVYVNAKVLAKKFMLRPDTTVRISRLKKIPYFAHIKKLDETGIDLLSDAAIIQHKGVYYGLMVLDDAGHLEACIAGARAGLFGPVKKNGEIMTVTAKDSFMLAWTDRLLAFIPKSKIPVTDNFIREIFSVEKEKSFSAGDKFTSCRRDAAALWFYARRLDLKIAPLAELKGYLEWDKDIDIALTENIAASYPGKMASSTRSMNSIHADVVTADLAKLLQGLTVAYMPEQAEQLNRLDLVNARASFELGGLKEIKNESISYVYDENFNKQKIVKVTVDTVNAAVLAIAGRNMKETVITNAPGSPYSVPSDGSGLQARFNQDMFRHVYPVPFPFEALIVQNRDKGWNEFMINIQVGSLGKLAELY